MGARVTFADPSRLGRRARIIRPSQMGQMADQSPASRSCPRMVGRRLIGILGTSLSVTETARPNALHRTDIRAWTLEGRRNADKKLLLRSMEQT